MQPQPSSTQTYHRRSRQIKALLFLLAWLIALAWVALNRQEIIDWWKLRSYEAPAVVSSLADQTTMNDYGRKIFYVNKPQLQDKSAFAESCLKNRIHEEQTIVLGCYHSNQAGIFLLSVTDPRLDGVQQVTAAHEMLHGAYDRLSDDERARIDKLLTDFYENDLKDERILGIIDAYKISEPNDVVNEMHSIFATEISSLPMELEQYYKRYFANRSRIVGFANKYQAVFTSRQAQLKQYQVQLDEIKQQITVYEQSLQSQQQTIESRQAGLNSLRQSGNIAAYNAEVVSYNTLIDNYNNGIEQLRALINQYNQLVVKHNELAQEQGQLAEELDADSPEPISSD